MLLQLLFVLIAIIIGARLGGIGLGVLGGLGLAILTFVFGLEPTSPPIDVMLMIVAVIAAASCMQAAGGLDLMVKWAEKLLRKNPSKITLLSPLVTYIFTFIAGTGHVAYSVLPHCGGHVLHPEHNLPAPHRQVRQRGHEFQRGLTACLI